MTYTELRQIILDFAVDTETTFAANIDNFIRATEKRICNEVDIPNLVVDRSVLYNASNATVFLPDDFLSMESLYITYNASGNTAVDYLLPKSPDFLTTAYPVYASTGRPRYYAIVGDAALRSMRVAPIPDSSYSGGMRYHAYPESIVDAASGTTWLGDNYEYALQYGALRDAAVFLKEEADVVDMYNKSYMEALGQIKTFGTERSRVDNYRRRG